MLGTGGDAGVDDIIIPTRACQGHFDHTGGVQPPLPMVPLVKHDDALEGSKLAAYDHRSVYQGVVTEDILDARRLNVGERGEGLSVLQKSPREGRLVQKSETGLGGVR